MPRLLALDTSTDACSVAVAIDGEIRTDHRVEPRGHARLLLPMIHGLLADAGLTPAMLDGIAFGRGPGSFTGLRIAAAAVQGIAWPLDLPVFPCSSLGILARAALEDAGVETAGAAGVITLVDARMDELYYNAFRREGEMLVALGEDRLLTPEAVGDELAGLSGGSWILAGDGLGLGERIPRAGFEGATELPAARPDARWLLAVAAADLAAGCGLDASRAVPVYLRDESRWRKLDARGR